jgi:hypothetical protein
LPKPKTWLAYHPGIPFEEVSWISTSRLTILRTTLKRLNKVSEVHGSLYEESCLECGGLPPPWTRPVVAALWPVASVRPESGSKLSKLAPSFVGHPLPRGLRGWL